MTAVGVAKQLRYRVETVWGTPPGPTGAQLLRRTSSTLALTKETFQSAEKSSHYQLLDMRHGQRQVSGAIEGELSCRTYSDFVAAALRRDFTLLPAMTGLSITIAGTGPTWTVTRSAGSYLTDGVKIGHVIRLTAGAFNTANSNKNLLVTALTATVATVRVINGTALAAEGPIASATVSVPGRITHAPVSAHTDRSFSVEEWHSDILQSELFTGCKVSSMRMAVPPNGMATIGFDFMGRDVVTATTAYYTSPTAETETGVLAGANGLLIVGGAAVAVVTGVDFTVAGGHTTQPVVGSLTMPEPAEGRILVTGNFTALFESTVLRNTFYDETEVGLILALAESPAAASHVLSVSLPRIKTTTATKDDPDTAITHTFGFSALLNIAGGAGLATERTTIAVQDTAVI